MIAAASNGGGYANLLRQHDGTGILEAVLAELWDFDTRISTTGSGGTPAPQDYLQPMGKPLRAYTQTPGNYAAGEAYVLADLRDPRWATYYADKYFSTAPRERPRLPPGPYNSTNATDGLHDLNCTHHLIRDFMFLDAAAHNQTANVAAGVALPTDASPYQLARVDLTPGGTDDPNLPKFTRGTGHNPNTKYLLDDGSFLPMDATNVLSFEARPVAFTALLYELRDGSGQAAAVAPNWFGVAVPDGITDFRNVVLYFHPNPGQGGAGYNPNDYAAKSGTAGTNWKELFAYVDRLGNQLAGAAKYAGTIPDGEPWNQIVVFPFMKAYDDVGILPQNWYYIIRDILDDIVLNGV